MKVTIDDVARRAGVSASTVSRALSGKGNLAPETVDLVRRVADELGYVPRKYTRKEAEQAGGTVSLLISGFHDLQNNTFYSQIVAGVESVLAGANYRLLFKTISGTLSEDREVIDELVPTQDGIVLVGYEVDVGSSRIRSSASRSSRRQRLLLNIDTVTNDNLSGAPTGDPIDRTLHRHRVRGGPWHVPR